MVGDILPGRGARGRWRAALLSLAALVSLVIVWKVGAYLLGRGVLERELLADIRAEWASLEEEERFIPEGANAAEVWEEAARVLPPALWCRVQAEEKGNVEGVLAKASPGLALVDRALEMEECLFPVKKPRSALGPFRVMPLGPGVQSDLVLRVPPLLTLRARRALSEGRTRDAVDDARRILGCVRHATSRWYEGPCTWGEAVRLANVILEDVLGRSDLAAGDARFIASLPGSSDLGRGRENQRRLHRLRTDIDLHALVSGAMRAGEAEDLRRELGLPGAIPLLGFSPSDIESIRDLRASPRRPVRGMESWPANGPPANLARLDLLRAAAALRAHGVERGGAARRLEDLVPDYLPAVPLDPWSGAPLVYEATEGGWSLRVPTGRVPAGVLMDGTWELQEVDLSFRWPARPVPESAWRPGGR